MSTKKDCYAVIGNPIAHSKSPLIHKLYALQTAQESTMSYDALCFGLDSFDAELDQFIKDGARGANVTVPFKQRAYARCDVLSTQARLAGAVNTLEFKQGKIYGNNTDGLGLVADLVGNHGFNFAGKKILILGAGGAVRGILQPIIDCAPAAVSIANRTLSKAEELAGLFSDKMEINCFEYPQLTESFDLIINGTSASLNNELPPIPDLLVSPDTWLYDMMYSKQVTVFNTWGLALGAKHAIDGLGMLVEQAAESFYIWRAIRPKSCDVIQQIRDQL